MQLKTRVPRVRGARVLVAMQTSGNSVWLKVSPKLVPLREFDQLTESVDHANARQAQAFGANAAAVKQLAQTVKRDSARLSRISLRQNRKLRKRISASDEKLKRRTGVSLKSIMRQMKVQQNKQMNLLRNSEWRDLSNQLVVVSAAPLMAAYGQRSNPFAENNLVIALSLGMWLFGDEISDLLSGKRSIQKGPIRSADMWSYIAPFMNLLTGWWLLNDRQHERFITGTSDLEDRVHVDGEQAKLFLMVDLSSHIALEHFADFQTFKDIPALATIQTLEFETSATDTRPQVSLFMTEVKKGLLWIGLKLSSQQAKLKQLRVAWSIDTQKPIRSPHHGHGP